MEILQEYILPYVFFLFLNSKKVICGKKNGIKNQESPVGRSDFKNPSHGKQIYD